MINLLYKLLSDVGILMTGDHTPTDTASRALLPQRIHQEQRTQTSYSLPSKHLKPKHIKIYYIIILVILINNILVIIIISQYFTLKFINQYFISIFKLLEKLRAN